MSQRLGFLSKAACFQHSFLDGVSCLKSVLEDSTVLLRVSTLKSRLLSASRASRKGLIASQS
jgi:hypothetical protein